MRRCLPCTRSGSLASTSTEDLFWGWLVVTHGVRWCEAAGRQAAPSSRAACPLQSLAGLGTSAAAASQLWMQAEGSGGRAADRATPSSSAASCNGSRCRCCTWASPWCQVAPGLGLGQQHRHHFYLLHAPLGARAAALGCMCGRVWYVCAWHGWCACLTQQAHAAHLCCLCCCG